MWRTVFVFEENLLYSRPMNIDNLESEAVPTPGLVQKVDPDKKPVPKITPTPHEDLLEITDILGHRAAEIEDSELLARAQKTGSARAIKSVEDALALPTQTGQQDLIRHAQLDDARKFIAYLELDTPEQARINAKIMSLPAFTEKLFHLHNIRADISAHHAQEEVQADSQARREVEAAFQAEFGHPMDQIKP